MLWCDISKEHQSMWVKTTWNCEIHGVEVEVGRVAATWTDGDPRRVPLLPLLVVEEGRGINIPLTARVELLGDNNG